MKYIDVVFICAGLILMYLTTLELFKSTLVSQPVIKEVLEEPLPKKIKIKPQKGVVLDTPFMYFANNIWSVTKEFECGPHHTCCNELPDDPGGFTCFSIAKKYHSLFHEMLETYKGILTYADKETIASLYIYRHYYLDPKIYELPKYWRLLIFDFAVHTNYIRAIKLFQNVAGVESDGKIGPKTIHISKKLSLNKYIEYNDRRLEFYRSRKNWKTHKRGWSKRVDKLNEIYKLRGEDEKFNRKKGSVILHKKSQR